MGDAFYLSSFDVETLPVMMAASAVFNILGLHFDAASLRTAFVALHTEDAQLRGTALEYLDTVLPAEIRDLVWPVLGEARPMRPARPAAEILADIVRVRDSSPI